MIAYGNLKDDKLICKQDQKYSQNTMDKTRLNMFHSKIKRRKKIVADMR